MAKPTYEELEAENAWLRARVAELEAKVARLEKLIQELSRRGKRQAAPFSKNKPKPVPKTPGRKPGDAYGVASRREPPAEIDEIHEAELPTTSPCCGGHVIETGVDVQYQTDIPQKPICRQFNIHVGTCEQCQQAIRGRHSLQTSDAIGAAASQLGPAAQAAAVLLNKKAGLSYGKIQGVFRDLFGIQVSRGGLSQTVARMAGRLVPTYQQIAATVASSPVVCPDETGWRVGGQSAWLHAAATPEATWYCVAKGRGGDVLEGLLGERWDGVLVHDGWAPYDRFEEATHQQCVFHIKTRCKELLEKAVGRTRLFPQRVLDLIDAALAERDRARTLDDNGRVALAESYADRLKLLVHAPKADADNERLARHLEKHEAEWFVFLADPAVPAANTLGEQAMRGPVVNRKVWGGNRTWVGAATQAVTCSVIDTCRKVSANAMGFLKDIACGITVTLTTRVAG